MKLIRAEKLSDNPTTTHVSIASEQLIEELADVLVAADAVGVPVLESCDNSKWRRWADYALRSNPNCFFAGQMTGVEGYMESAASGILAGQNLARRMQGKAPLILPRETMMGALAAYISDETVAQFQPMGCNMGILPELPERIRDKREKYQAYADRALAALDAYLQQTAENTTEGEGQ